MLPYSQTSEKTFDYRIQTQVITLQSDELYWSIGQMSLRSAEVHYSALLTFMYKNIPQQPKDKNKPGAVVYISLLCLSTLFWCAIDKCNPHPSKNIHSDKKILQFHKVLNRQRLSKQYPKGNFHWHTVSCQSYTFIILVWPLSFALYVG